MVAWVGPQRGSTNGVHRPVGEGLTGQSALCVWLQVWKELRHLSLVELIRALLILVTERLERDITSMGSRVGQSASQDS